MDNLETQAYDPAEAFALVAATPVNLFPHDKAPQGLDSICRCPTVRLGEIPSECKCGCTPEPQQNDCKQPDPPTGLLEFPEPITSPAANLVPQPDPPTEPLECPEPITLPATAPVPPTRPTPAQRLKVYLNEARQERLAKQSIAEQKNQETTTTDENEASKALDPTDRFVDELQVEVEKLQQAAANAEVVALEDSCQKEEREKDTEPTGSTDKNCKVGSHVLPPEWTVLEHISPEAQRALKPKAKAKGKAKAKARAAAAANKNTEEGNQGEPAKDLKEDEPAPKRRRARKGKDEEEKDTTPVAKAKCGSRKRKVDECDEKAAAPVPKVKGRPRKAKDDKEEPTVEEKGAPVKRSKKRKADEDKEDRPRKAKDDKEGPTVEKKEASVKRSKKRKAGEDNEAMASQPAAPARRRRTRANNVDPNESKALKSRKSAAYHRAVKQKREEGEDEETAKQAGKKAT
eukprot:Skav228949  [mRNA]  locus=scaffold366:14059:15438:+ [translate_table: standard]